MINRFKKINKKKGGALLLELLIVISLLAVILSVGVNAIFLSMRSNQVSGERDVASGLASESLEAVRAITEENWQNIYSLTKNSQHYYPVQSGGKWILSPGDGTVTLNNIVYTRYVTIDNVSRDNTTRNVETSYSSANDDPSTQKVTTTVSWSTGSPVVMFEYFFRWKNKICNQTDWSLGVGSAGVDCPNTKTYGSKDDSVNISGGQLKL